MGNAAIYARSSLGKNRQGDTVEHQVAMIKEFATRSDIMVEFDDNYIFEEDGESGYKTTLLQRPAMRRLMESIDNGEIEIVFFKGISRFARDSGETITTAKRLSNKGVRVISLEENFDSFRDDPTMFQIYAVMAEQESRKTSVRVSLGNKQKARMGLWSNSTTPLGYSKIKDLEDELKNKLVSKGFHPHSLYPNDDSIIIEIIFDLYVNKGWGRKKIVSHVNEKGYRTKKGNLFNEKIISDILNNEVYVGNIVYGKKRYEYVQDDEDSSSRKVQKEIKLSEDDWARKDNAHPPIVDEDVFKKARSLIAKRKGMYNFGKKFNAAKHPLTGLLVCGKCGQTMICQKRTNKTKSGDKKEYRYYVCSTYHTKGRSVCNQKNINATKLESGVFSKLYNEMNEYLKNVDVESKVESQKNIQKQYQKEMTLIENNMNKKVNASKTLMEMRDVYDKETFMQLNKEINEEIKSLRKQLNELKSNMENVEGESFVYDISLHFERAKDINHDNLVELRDFFKSVLSSVIISNEDITEINSLLKIS